MKYKMFVCVDCHKSLIASSNNFSDFQTLIVIDFNMTIKVTHIVYDTTDNEEQYLDMDLPTELVFDIDGDSDDIEYDIVDAIGNITGWTVKSFKWSEVVK